MPYFLEPLFGDSPRAAAIFYGVAGAAVLLALVILWQVFGHGPRRGRGLERARRRLAAGAGQDALERVRKLRHLGAPSAAWIKRLDEAETACHKAAARQALENKQFEEALGLLLRGARLVGEQEGHVRTLVQAAMLDEVRFLFSAVTLGNINALQELIDRAMAVQVPCQEASFWQALCLLKGDEPERAIASLQAARGGELRSAAPDDGQGASAMSAPVAAPAFIDPPLYLGAVLLRRGFAKEALKYLTEANRIDGNCPIVTLQLGAAMIATGGDPPLAVRALQRALGPRGLETWAQEPRRAWVEGLPEGRSYIRKLASVYPFVCPLWGSDLNVLVQQGSLALAQGLYKLAAYPEAAELFSKVLQNGAPSLAGLRGLGLALARLGKYDDAFKHLRSALEMEEPKDRITAGYLALCGAKGKPTHPEDKGRNVLWALSLVARFNAPGDQEWVQLVSDLLAEARDAKVSLSLDEQLYACEHLWSVTATDAQAALAYNDLQASYPQAVRPEYAWLYCRSAQRHQAGGGHGLELFARTFADPEPARAFFAERDWDWVEVEYTYLERTAALAPGNFPAVLGADYGVRGEELLLARSRLYEEAGTADEALAAAEILVKLAPQSPHALERLAFLYHRQGKLDESVRLLETWAQRHPDDPLPLMRCAILLHERGLVGECQTKLREALKLCEGPRRARIAFLGARLTLQSALAQGASEGNGGTSLDDVALGVAEEFLLRCLDDDPIHADALWCVAAVRWLRGGRESLAAQAALMKSAEVLDARFLFFAALCCLAAQDFAGVLEICARIPALDSPLPLARAARNGDALRAVVVWPAESAYLSGLAHLSLGQNAAAFQALEKPATSRESPTVPYAQALLGSVAFMDQRHAEAARWWQALDSKRRTAWRLGEALAQTVFLSAIEAYGRGHFEEAAQRLRAAGKLGCRDRRLGSLLVASLFKAGQTMIYATALRVHS